MSVNSRSKSSHESGKEPQKLLTDNSDLAEQYKNIKNAYLQGFIIVFETGIIVISHWKRNNYIQKDRYKETMYKSEKSFLKINGSNVYEKTDIVCIQSGYKSDTQVSIGKDRLDKVNVGRGV